jgi:hypothetical protein
MRTYLTALALVCALASVAIADGKHHRFVGIHPVPKGHGGGLCHIEAHHVHLYAPVDVKVQYRVHDGWHHFVGDPVAYGWEGPKHSYYGHHPIEIHAVVGDDHEDTAYCYLEGPHYHAWAPPPGVQLELRGGAYWYVGDFPEAYATGRATYDPIDVVYQPIRYQRPAVTVEVAPAELVRRGRGRRAAAGRGASTAAGARRGRGGRAGAQRPRRDRGADGFDRDRRRGRGPGRPSAQAQAQAQAPRAQARPRPR